jgi:hypothetical protein
MQNKIKQDCIKRKPKVQRKMSHIYIFIGSTREASDSTLLFWVFP